MMQWNEVETNILKLMKPDGDGSTLLEMEKEKWQELYDALVLNKALALTFDKAKASGKVPSELLAMWDAEKFKIFVRQKKIFYAMMEVCRIFSEKAISYALFKGQVVADCYPNPYFRMSVDSDVYVDSKDRERACEILENLGYEFLANYSKTDIVTTWYKREAGHKIELHTCLYENYTGKQIDILKSFELEAKEKRTQVDLDGNLVWTLGPTEHLLFQLFHMAKHFILEGVSVRYLTDIALFVNRYRDNIDWNGFWKMAEKAGYADFANRLFYLCGKHFSMNTNAVLTADLAMDEEAEKRLLLDLIYKGNSNRNKKEGDHYHFAPVLQEYLVGDDGSSVGASESILSKKFFPPAKELSETYRYAKKHPALLPIAWVHRPIHYVWYRINRRIHPLYTREESEERIQERIDNIEFLMGSDPIKNV